MRPYALNLTKNGIAIAAIIPTVLLFDGAGFPSLSQTDWLIVIVSGVIGIAIADTLYLEALKTIGAARTGIVGSLFSPSVILLSYIFLGERLSWWQWSGFVLVLFGVLMVSYRQPNREVDSKALTAGILAGIAGVFLMAAGVVMVKPILEVHSLLWIVAARLIAGQVGMLLYSLWRNDLGRLHAELRQPHRWNAIILASILGTYLSLILWLAGYKYTLASIASVLNETASIFIVLLAWLVLREPMSKAKFIGVGLTFTGVIVLMGVI